MKHLVAIVMVAAFVSACVPRNPRVQAVSDTTASGPACKEIALAGKPARCEAIAPEAISGGR